MYSDNRWDEVTAGRVYPASTRYLASNRHVSTAYSDNRWHLAKVGRVYLKDEPLTKPHAYKSLAR